MPPTRTKRICRTKSRRTSPKPSGTSPPKVDRQPANRPQLESCHAMTRLWATHSEKLSQTARVRATGGREHGVARSSDGQLDVRLSTPGDAGSGTNPEQLLAAGWSACFESALDLRRDHAEGRPGRAGQFRYLPDATHQRDAGHRGPHCPEFRAARRDGRARYLGHRSRGANAIFAATGKRLRKMPVDSTVLGQPA